MGEPKAKSWSMFKQDLGALFEHYPAAKFGCLFMYSFTLLAFLDAFFAWHQQYSFGGHVVEIAWRSLVFSVIFFYVLRRKPKAQTDPVSL